MDRRSMAYNPNILFDDILSDTLLRNTQTKLLNPNLTVDNYSRYISHSDKNGIAISKNDFNKHPHV